MSTVPHPKKATQKFAFITFLAVVSIFIFTLYLMNFQFWLIPQKIEEAIYGDPNKIIVKDCFDPVEWQNVPYVVKKAPELPKKLAKIEGFDGLAQTDIFLPPDRIPKLDTTIQVRIKSEPGQNETKLHVEALMQNASVKMQHVTMTASIRQKNVISGGETMHEIYCEQLNSQNSVGKRFFQTSFSLNNPLVQKKSKSFMLNLECIYELDPDTYGQQRYCKENYEVPLVTK